MVIIFIKGDKVKFIGNENAHIPFLSEYLKKYPNIFTISTWNGDYIITYELPQIYFRKDEFEVLELTTKKLQNLKEKNKEKNMESNDKLKTLLNQWKKRKIEFYIKTFDEVEEGFIDTDKNVKDYIKMIKKIEEEYKHFNDTHDDAKVELNTIMDKERKERLITAETRKNVKTTKEKKQRAIDYLDEIIADVYAASSIYENEENIKKVLIKYGIIDKDGSLIIG